MSTETKWTPGPWALSYDTGSVRDVVAYPNPLPICAVKQAWVTREQYGANAHLIAASPDLYEALSSIEDLLAHYEDCAKPEFDGAHPSTRVNGEDLATLLETARSALAKARGEG